MMKAMRILMASGTAVVVGFSAGLVQAAGGVDVTMGGDLNSAYVWRGQTLNEDPVFQPSVDLVSNDSGLGLNIWGNLDIGDNDGALEEGEFSEVDLTVSYALPLEDLDVSIGAIYYIFPSLGGDNETTELFVSLGHAVDAVSLGADIYYDVDVYEDIYANLSASVNVPLTEDFSVDVGGAVGIAGEDAAGFTDSGFADWNVSISTETPMSESCYLGVFVAYTDSFDEDVLVDQETDVYGGISVYGSL